MRDITQPRTCIEPSCETVLSMYNPNPRCAFHHAVHVQKQLALADWQALEERNRKRQRTRQRMRMRQGGSPW